jgi:hypothetical protein
MARRPTERPLTEHIATLTRVVSQVSVSEGIQKSRRTAIMKRLGEVIALLQKELTR